MIKIVEGDITRLAVDAVVNAANPELRPGGGVCGAIHGTAGPQLAETCRELGGCPTGEARLTEGFDLPAPYVIHAVGPVWHGGDQREEELLASTYRACLALAREHRITRIAFPAISTGIYGYPLEEACRIAVTTIRTFLSTHDLPRTVILCGFDESTAHALRAAIEAA